VHPGDLARECSDLEMTWLLCCAGAATGYPDLDYDAKVLLHLVHAKGASVPIQAGRNLRPPKNGWGRNRLVY